MHYHNSLPTCYVHATTYDRIDSTRAEESEDCGAHDSSFLVLPISISLQPLTGAWHFFNIEMVTNSSQKGRRLLLVPCPVVLFPLGRLPLVLSQQQPQWLGEIHEIKYGSTKSKTVICVCYRGACSSQEAFHIHPVGTAPPPACQDPEEPDRPKPLPQLPRRRLHMTIY